MRSVLAVFLLAACSSAPVVPRSYAPSEVRELSALPPGYVAGSMVHAQCDAALRDSFEDEALADVDCSFSRLSRILLARAGEASALFIVGKRCAARGVERVHRQCSATLARATGQVALVPDKLAGEPGPAPSAAQIMDLDEPRPQDSDIRVSYRPSSRPPAALPPRSYDQVAETHFASVGRRELGQVSARCEEGCPDSALRHALRVAAGQVGAGEVAAVTCFKEEEGARCVATALVPWSS